MVTDVLDRLEPGHARRLESGEAEMLLAGARIVDEQDSGMTGPIRVLGLAASPGRWILEADTRRRPILRRLRPEEDPVRFIAERREAYERMWDG